MTVVSSGERRWTDVDGNRNGFTMDRLIGLHTSHAEPESQY